MPKPTEERVSQLVAGLVERRGFDLEGVEISTAGTRLNGPAGERDDQTERPEWGCRSSWTVTADPTVTRWRCLSTELSELLDEAGDFGETAYLLEVLHARHESPVYADRHWRRARGGKCASTSGRVCPRPNQAFR